MPRITVGQRSEAKTLGLDLRDGNSRDFAEGLLRTHGLNRLPPKESLKRAREDGMTVKYASEGDVRQFRNSDFSKKGADDRLRVLAQLKEDGLEIESAIRVNNEWGDCAGWTADGYILTKGMQHHRVDPKMVKLVFPKKPQKKKERK